ncbi:MAG TPA: heme-binding protein, partial [Roseovarius sp.]|nr:heme-binding protein [Roseovarius sp.]
MAELSLNRARSIIRKALAKGREAGFKPLSVVVLDTGGHVKAFEREDGSA